MVLIITDKVRNKPTDLSAWVIEERGHVRQDKGVCVTQLSDTLYPNGHTGTVNSPGVGCAINQRI